MAVVVEGAGARLCVAVEGSLGASSNCTVFYALAGARRRGISEALVRWPVARARELGGVELLAYLDIPFTDAHLS